MPAARRHAHPCRTGELRMHRPGFPRQALLIALVGLVAACSGQTPSGSAPQAGQAATSQAAASTSQRKSLTIAIPSDINALVGGVGLAGINSQSSHYVQAFVHSFVTTTDRDS